MCGRQRFDHAWAIDRGPEIIRPSAGAVDRGPGIIRPSGRGDRSRSRDHPTIGPMRSTAAPGSSDYRAGAIDRGPGIIRPWGRCDRSRPWDHPTIGPVRSIAAPGSSDHRGRAVDRGPGIIRPSGRCDRSRPLDHPTIGPVRSIAAPGSSDHRAGAIDREATRSTCLRTLEELHALQQLGGGLAERDVLSSARRRPRRARQRGWLARASAPGGSRPSR